MHTHIVYPRLGKGPTVNHRYGQENARFFLLAATTGGGGDHDHSHRFLFNFYFRKIGVELLQVVHKGT